MLLILGCIYFFNPCQVRVLDRQMNHFQGLDKGEVGVCNAGAPGSIPGSERPPGEGNGYPLQYSCLENPMDRGAWQAIVHGAARSQT